MSRVCILVTGRPVASAERLRGGFADMVRRAAGESFRGDWLDLDATSDAPLPADVAGIVITGSPASVTEQTDWMRRRQVELARAVERDLPVLGICFGHQLLGQALGGRVTPNPRGREIGSVELTLSASDPLLDGTRTVNMSHVDVVAEPPPGARVIAATERDPHAVLRFSARALGVQFHPEFDAEIVRCYVRERRPAIVAEGLDAAAIEAAAEDTPQGAAVLTRFLAGL